MPDQMGAFLKADRCISKLGLNITRVSYNKAVDAHMLFIEVEGSKEQLALADRELGELGYLNNQAGLGSVILIEFKLRDVPGALLPILELIQEYSFNISYISSQENGTEYQFFKMGLFVENGRKISEFIRRAVMLCRIKIIDYSKSEKILDNTVFYLSYADHISEKMGLSDEEKNKLVISSNLIMQMLDERNRPPYKTFDYIGRFADMLNKYRGEGFVPRITRHESTNGTPILLIEPPCGSNVCVMISDNALYFVDSGFALYKNDLCKVLRHEIPRFDNMRKELLLTHADVDHSGCVDMFDRVYVNKKCYDNFIRENNGKAAFREENPIHSPYVQISKILSGYHPAKTDNLTVIGDDSNGLSEALTKTGVLNLGKMTFELYEGQGGHVSGEMIYIERSQRLAFTGDIFVNIKGFTKEQAAFNKLAPYLMTSVDTNPALAKEEREYFRTLLDPGKWRVFGGHGSAAEIIIE